MRNERGIALVFVLFLVTTISALAVSLTFLANSETYASGNYRLATQARYAAESGAQAAADFLLDPNKFNPALIAKGIPGVNTDVFPATYNGLPITLSTSGNSNFPDDPTKTAFGNVKGFLPIGNGNSIAFGATAQLMSEESFEDSYGGHAIVTAQRWEITAQGTIAGVHSAVVEITATIETPKVPAFAYAAFATNDQCKSLWFHGSSTTNSYNSAKLAALGIPAPVDCTKPPHAGETGSQCMNNEGGDVGTNGNMLVDGGAVDVYGNLSTPRQGVGDCNNAGQITALSGASADVHGGSPISLPKAVSLKTPTIQTPSPLGSITKIDGTTCGKLGLGIANCKYTPGGGGSSDELELTNTNSTPLKLPMFDLKAAADIRLVASTNPAISNEYDFNAISLSGQASIGIRTPSKDAEVVVRVAGKDSSGEIDPAINFNGGTYAAPVGTCGASCSSYNAALLQFVYGGTKTVNFQGNSSASATIYAPNAPMTLVGTEDFYGAVLGKTIEVAGSASVYYDQNLGGVSWTVGQPMMTAFSWKNKNN